MQQGKHHIIDFGGVIICAQFCTGGEIAFDVLLDQSRMNEGRVAEPILMELSYISIRVRASRPVRAKRPRSQCMRGAFYRRRMVASRNAN